MRCMVYLRPLSVQGLFAPFIAPLSKWPASRKQLAIVKICDSGVVLISPYSVTLVKPLESAGVQIINLFYSLFSFCSHLLPGSISYSYYFSLEKKKLAKFFIQNDITFLFTNPSVLWSSISKFLHFQIIRFDHLLNSEANSCVSSFRGLTASPIGKLSYLIDKVPMYQISYFPQGHL